MFGQISEHGGPVTSTHEINHHTDQVKILKHGRALGGTFQKGGQAALAWRGRRPVQGCVHRSVARKRSVRDAANLRLRPYHAELWRARQGVGIYSESNGEKNSKGTNMCSDKCQGYFWKDLPVPCGKWETGCLADKIFALLNNEYQILAEKEKNDIKYVE